MESITGILSTFWYDILGFPITLVEGLIDGEIPQAVAFCIRIALTLITIYLIFDVWRRFWKGFKKVIGRDKLVDDGDLRALNQAHADNAPGQNAEAVQNLDATIARLKQDKNYAAMADAYTTVNKHKDAAKWFKKAGDKHQAAHAMARAGMTLKAAKLLQKLSDHEAAARLFAEKGKHDLAAKAYATAGKHGDAAVAHAEAGDPEAAFLAYTEYFTASDDPVERQIELADKCKTLLGTDGAADKLSDDAKKTLLPQIAMRFEQAKRYVESANLYGQAGDLARAAETFVLAGKLREAAQCYQQAGKEKESSQIVGRYHETREEWPKAAAAYAKAADFLKAGECFTKAADMARAAECFERVKEFYRAGLSYAKAARFKDAIRVLQQLTDKSPNFDESRGLLGRCFYELHDYSHCAAALDNHLTGERVDSSNMDLFYMLALAYEQLGKLDKCRELLYKIRSVSTSFRDVTQRISSVSSRISMQSGATQVTPYSGDGSSGGGGGGGAAPMMENVENSLEGRYELEKELGRGGMGVVYMARDKQLDRKVALKFLGTLIDNSDEYRQRFVREARTAAKISHPNVINIFDISASVGKAYIAMEFVDGPSLHAHMSKKGAFDTRKAVNIILQSAAALAAIHEAGIVHRDIKPDNILIAKGGLVKVMDFGLAKAEDSRMTKTGVVMGTPSYMSPEQVFGKEADARSDIYSLGLVFYECLSGKTVFKTGDILERQIKEMPAPPSEVVKGLPKAIDDIILKSIAKKPEERYQSMGELGTALRALEV